MPKPFRLRNTSSDQAQADPVGDSIVTFSCLIIQTASWMHPTNDQYLPSLEFPFCPGNASEMQPFAASLGPHHGLASTTQPFVSGPVRRLMINTFLCLNIQTPAQSWLPPAQNPLSVLPARSDPHPLPLIV